MKYISSILFSFLLFSTSPAQTADTTASAEPFAFGDFSWMQGNNRQHSALLDSKYFTGDMTLDCNVNISNHHPVDHSTVGSTATFREGEFNISYLEIGGDFHYEHARARIMLQLGTRATGIPRNDASTLRGQYDLANALRYLTEGYVGYHWNAWHGINLDFGIFKSYVGLLSYNNFENWNYQPSYMSDNTPWFFTGARLQTFPSDRLKIELWLVNGWQTYGMFNNIPGLGFQMRWSPEEWMELILSGYRGYDTPTKPDRLRLHTDNSLVIREFSHPDNFISKGAFSFTADLGVESGNDVSPFGSDSLHPAQNFMGFMFYHRLWFDSDRIGWTFGGGYLHSPGRYLVLLPPGAGANVFTQNPGDKFDAWDVSTTIQYMPTEYNTFLAEVVYREANVPYFAGHGGVTSPNGYNPPLGDLTNFVPDLVKNETRFIFATMVRF